MVIELNTTPKEYIIDEILYQWDDMRNSYSKISYYAVTEIIQMMFGAILPDDLAVNVELEDDYTLDLFGFAQLTDDSGAVKVYTSNINVPNYSDITDQEGNEENAVKLWEFFLDRVITPTTQGVNETTDKLYSIFNEK